MLVIAFGVLSFGSIGSAASTSLVINEVDYDQPGLDTAEFFELKNVSGSAINLDDYRVELINGASGGNALYRTVDLPPVSLAAGDYYVVCANTATVANCDFDGGPDDLIQNGAPDALRLVTGFDPVIVLDTVSYEGDTTGNVEGSGVDLVDTAAAADESISRCPDGADSDVNNTDFSLRTSSPGAANVCAGPKVVINEVDYDQPGTDTAEFLELKNTAAVAVNLDPYSVELVNGSGGAVYATFDLPAVSLAGGDYFVICADTATTANCDLNVTPDSNLIQNGAPDGLRLVLAGTTVDALSYEGNTAGATEGSGVGLEDLADEGLSRCPDGNDTDANNVDFSLRAITPGGTNVCAGPKVVINEVDYDQVGTDGAEYLELKNTSTAAVNLDPYVVELVNGSGGVVYGTFDLPAFSLAGGDYFVICANAATVANCDLDVDPNTDRIQNGSPDGIRLLLAGATVDALSYEGDTAGSTEGTGTAAADSNSEAGIGLSRCADGVDTDNNNADFAIKAITPGTTNACEPPPPDPVGNCGEPATRIHVVQGSGPATLFANTQVTIEGVVVADVQGAGQFDGYYVQEEAADADTDPQTSEGIFVFSGVGVDNVSLGEIVRVRGTAGESFALTQLSSVSAPVKCGTGSVPATSVTLPVATVDDHESFEGMLVSYAQTLTATEVFNLGRFGEVSLSGAGRLYNTTAVALPGAPAQAVAAQNARSRIILDDASNTQNNDPTRYPQGGLSATNTLRVGDTLNGLDGVMDFRFGNYRIQPVGAVDFIGTNMRTPAPGDVGGNLKVASFNVLNYFNDFGCGDRCRGAENQFEFDRQEAKIVSALKAIDGDIVGLMEIENDGGPGNSLAELVAALNAATAPGTYAYIDTGVIGTDAIKVALIYQPAAVAPVGDWDILTTADDPRFIDTRNRPTLAQTFRHVSSGQVITVAVNHLKSKGSACGGAPDDQPDTGGGNCNGTRTAAAAALADWLVGDPTGSGDPDFLIIGDLNSYTFETPIQELEAGGFTNLVKQFNGLTAYSYVFNGESGYLDHALGTASIASQVTGVTEWHINPDEPTVLDYNTNFKSAGHVSTLYDPGPYRSSDHDPVIIGLQMNHAPTADAGGPYTVAEGSSVTIAATGGDADGDTLTYAWDLDNDGEFDDATGQTASFSAALIDGPASRTIRVRVSDGALSTIDDATVNVTNVAPTASFNAPASVFAGFPIELSLTNATDAAPADRPGLTYAFDCGSGYGAFSASSTASCPTDDVGTRSVGGKVRDDDGGVTEYRATVAVVVTFDSLCDLVRVYVDKQDVADSLCDKLDAAEAKRARTGVTDLKAFVNQVEAQSGKSMTATEAATLIRLAGAL
ncbi:MAG TPA: ExeM/NucH family extracellular endonuclease [Gaiellaceae bacterium]|nr:ExeM/NucH family extracellular endonuclease [Gaiellaceae bacterium]